MNYCQCGEQATREWVAFHGAIHYEAFLCDNCQEKWKNCFSNGIKAIDLQHFNFKPVLKEGHIETQEDMKSKLDELIRRLEYLHRDYQNVPLRLARDIRDVVIGWRSVGKQDDN